ncbi:hypothetical protein SAMN05421803_101710 [Nocardiopsis flavescens]|uniref:Uncharacterized protein n=1 Tax=Nocardiopsis flavescens TaxID=758803 RepID=A0A1M6CHM8_9ACTN|nr:hypothetical protein [Nocardiopsis flavescens]SHI60509.1 hypothetical protein SAMN05421803_101710 [Nocardiopsis flavescens]
MTPTTTQTGPARAIHDHPEVRRAHQTLHRARQGRADGRVREAPARVAAALRTDPTLALEVDGQRTADLIAELIRQLKPLSRQAGLAHTHARLPADPYLPGTDRQHQINRLGKVNPAAIDQE